MEDPRFGKPSAKIVAGAFISFSMIPVNVRGFSFEAISAFHLSIINLVLFLSKFSLRLFFGREAADKAGAPRLAAVE
jgi:hypothetical protein